MELHNPHQVTHKKKWSEYLLEFFMLFLAVFLGFLAENERENIAEKHREHQFINSLTQDLRVDIRTLDSLITIRNHRRVMIDSLLLLLKTPDSGEHGRELYYYARSLTYTYKFVNNDRTIQQLKNGGNLRLISNQEVSDKIMDYDQNVRFVTHAEAREESFIQDYIHCLEELFDIDEFDKMLDKNWGFNKLADNPRLVSTDKTALQKLRGILHFLKAANIYILNWDVSQKNRAESTLDFIKKEYHIK